MDRILYYLVQNCKGELCFWSGVTFWVNRTWKGLL